MLLVLAAFAVSSAKAAGSNHLPSDGETNVQIPHELQPAGIPFEGSERDPEAGILNAGSLLFAQAPATWCYTSYGRFPMVVALPVGVSCTVNVAFYPYTLYGTTGY
jgi:hypothetical protein